MSVSRTYWLETATKKIRFSGDREAVYRELEGHLLDRMERYLAQGMSETEASRAATADMGDAEEIAEELGRIHAPWWGYLWKLSRWVLVLAAVWAVFLTAAELEPWGKLRTEFPQYTPAVGDVHTYAQGRQSQVLAVWQPRVRQKLGHYRVTVPTAYLEQGEAFTYEDGYEAPAYSTLHVWVKAATWRFWEPMAAGQFMILDRYAADSSGNVYGWDPTRDPEQVRSLFCCSYANPLSVWWDVEFDIPAGDEAPEWVDIPLGYGGHTIRVELEKGGGKP